MRSSEAKAKTPKDGVRLLQHLDGKPGDLVGGEVLGRCGDLAGDELAGIAGRDVEHEARQAEIPLGEHGRDDRGDDRGQSLRGLQPGQHLSCSPRR